MSVYVDDQENGFGRMKMCHMIADTSEELISMARRIGVLSKWIQYPATWKEHYDVCKSKREAAIREGAIPISGRELASKISARRKACTP